MKELIKRWEAELEELEKQEESSWAAQLSICLSELKAAYVPGIDKEIADKIKEEYKKVIDLLLDNKCPGESYILYIDSITKVPLTEPEQEERYDQNLDYGELNRAIEKEKQRQSDFYDGKHYDKPKQEDLSKFLKEQQDKADKARMSGGLVRDRCTNCKPKKIEPLKNAWIGMRSAELTIDIEDYHDKITELVNAINKINKVD